MNTFIVTQLEPGDTLYLDMSYGFPTNFCTRNNHTSHERKLLVNFHDGKSYFFDGRYCINCCRAYVSRNYYASTINTTGKHDLHTEIVLQDGTFLSDIGKTTQNAVEQKDYPERASRSLLNKRGYNVGQTDDLPDWKRQEILKDIIDSGELTQGYVCSHLKYLIKINGRSKTNWLAVQKWTRDLEFVQSLKHHKKISVADFLKLTSSELDDNELPF